CHGLSASAVAGDGGHHFAGAGDVAVGVDDDVEAVGSQLAADRAAEVAAAAGDQGTARGGGGAGRGGARWKDVLVHASIIPAWAVRRRAPPPRGLPPAARRHGGCGTRTAGWPRLPSAVRPRPPAPRRG